MTGGEWPPLVPDPPGQEGRLAAIVPKFPSTAMHGDVGFKKKVVTLEAGSLTSAYGQLEKHRLQPVPVGSEFFCEGSPTMTVVQDNVKMNWDLMRVAVPRTNDKVVDGVNTNDKALDGPAILSRHSTGSLGEKEVNMVKKRGRKKMTSAKKKNLENRSIFCGPAKKTKKNRSRKKKSKACQKDAQEAAVLPKVDK